MTDHRIPLALAALALLALALGGALGIAAWRHERHANVTPIGVLFAANLFRAMLDFVVEEVAVRR